MRLGVRRRARRERRHCGDRADDAVVHGGVRRGELLAPRPVVDGGDEALQLGDPAHGPHAPLDGAGEVGALVERVELALVDRVDAGLDDAVDAREPHLIARCALDRRPAGEARVRRGLPGDVAPADVEPVGGAPLRRAAVGDRTHAGVCRVRRSRHPRKRQRDGDGRALQRRTGPEDGAVLEVRSLRELELVAGGAPDRSPRERRSPGEVTDGGLAGAEQERLQARGGRDGNGFSCKGRAGDEGGRSECEPEGGEANGAHSPYVGTSGARALPRTGDG